MKVQIMLMTGLVAINSSQGAMMRGQGALMRGQLDVANYVAKSPALSLMLEECGDKIGDGGALDLQVGDGTGNCPDNGECTNFYTARNLFLAIDAYNDGKTLENQFPNAVQGSRCLTFAAFLGQTVYESGHYKACKEYVYVQPCPIAEKCSDSKASDYSPDNQGDWNPKTVPGTGRPGPSQGCTDYWGRKEDPQNCWFGRGAIQITWLPNYNAYAPEYINNPDQICEQGKAGWAGSVAYWNQFKNQFDGSCTSATSIPNPARCDSNCHQARCDAQAKFMSVLMPQTSPPTPPPPSSGTWVVPSDVASGGCWQIIDTVCPGQGNSWSDNLCSPAHAPGVCPTIRGGDTIHYDCNGCA